MLSDIISGRISATSLFSSKQSWDTTSNGPETPSVASELGSGSVQQRLVVVTDPEIRARTLHEWITTRQQGGIAQAHLSELHALMKSRFGQQAILPVASDEIDGRTGTPKTFTASELWERVFDQVPESGADDMRLHYLHLVCKLCVVHFIIGSIPSSEMEVNDILSVGQQRSTEEALEEHTERSDCDIKEACRRLGVEFGLGQYEDMLRAPSSAARPLSGKLQRSLDKTLRKVMSRRVWCLEALRGHTFFEGISARAGEGSCAGLEALLSQGLLLGRQASERVLDREMELLATLQTALEYFDMGIVPDVLRDGIESTPAQDSVSRVLCRHRNMAVKLAERVSAYADDLLLKTNCDYDDAKKRPGRGASQLVDNASWANPMWTPRNFMDPTMLPDMRDLRDHQKVALVLLHWMQKDGLKRSQDGSTLLRPVCAPVWRVQRFAECLACGKGQPWCKCGDAFVAGPSVPVCRACHRARHASTDTSHAFEPLSYRLASRRGSKEPYRMVNTRAFVSEGGVAEVCRRMCKKDGAGWFARSLWRIFTSNKGVQDAVVDQIEKHTHKELPVLRETTEVWAYRDGLLWTCYKGTCRPRFYAYECGPNCRHSLEPSPEPHHLFRPRVLGVQRGTGGGPLEVRVLRRRPDDTLVRRALSYDLCLEDGRRADRFHVPLQIFGWCDGREHQEDDRVRVYFEDGLRCAWYRVRYEQVHAPETADVEIGSDAFFLLAAELNRASSFRKLPLLRPYLLSTGVSEGPQAFAEAIGEDDDRQGEAFVRAAKGCTDVESSEAGYARFSAVVSLLAAWELGLLQCSSDFAEGTWPAERYADQPCLRSAGEGEDDVELPAHLTSPGEPAGFDDALADLREAVANKRGLGCEFTLDREAFLKSGRLVIRGVPDHMLSESFVRRHTHCIGCFGQDPLLLPLNEVVARKHIEPAFVYDTWRANKYGPTLPLVDPSVRDPQTRLEEIARRRHVQGIFRRDAPPSRNQTLARAPDGCIACRRCRRKYRVPEGGSCTEQVCRFKGACGSPCVPWIVREGLFDRGSRVTTPNFNKIYWTQHLCDPGEPASVAEPVPRRSKCALSMVKCVLGRLLFPGKFRDNWQIAVFQKGHAETGKSLTTDCILEAFTTDQKCVLSDNCQKDFTGYRDDKLIVVQMEFGSNTNRSLEEFLSTVANETYYFNRKHKEPITGDSYPVQQIYNGNNMPQWINTSSAVSRRLFIIPYNHLVHKKQDNLNQLMQTQELGYLLADIAFSFLWYSEAHRGRTIWDFCPKVFLKCRDDNSTQDSFKAFLEESTEELVEAPGAFIPASHLKKKFKEFCAVSGRKMGTWSKETYSFQAEKRRLKVVKDKKKYPPEDAPPAARQAYVSGGGKQVISRVLYFEGIGLRSFFGHLKPAEAADTTERDPAVPPAEADELLVTDDAMESLYHEICGMTPEEAEAQLHLLTKRLLSRLT